MTDNNIKRVIDKGLSDMKMTEQNMNAVMRRIQGSHELPPRRVKKMTVVVAIVLALLLISTVAVAAMSLWGVFERSFEIEQEETGMFIEDWSMEHQMELIELLTSIGEDLDAEKTALLYSDELSDEEKKELVVEILSECYDLNSEFIDTLSILLHKKGPIENWTHEERAWLSEQQNVTLSYEGDVRYLVPTDDDLPEEEAYAIAYQYYDETLGLGRECFDLTHQFASFGEVLAENDTIIKNWHLSLALNIDQYEGKKLAWNELTVDISDDGEILSADELTFRTWRDDWYDTAMAEDFWTIEGLCAFKEEWEPRAEQLEHEGIELSRDLQYLLDKPYGLPSEDDLSLEDARAIAKSVLLNLPGWDEEMQMYYGTREAYYVGNPNQYCIVYTILDADSEVRNTADDLNFEGKIPISVRICIDAKSGDAIDVYQNDSCWDFPDRLGI